MKSIMRKTTLREIKLSLGRYLAIVAIVALGVGFFAGLRVTKTAMIKTGDEYCNTYQLSDFQLISTLGFEQEDVEAIEKMEQIRSVSGSISTDVIIQSQDSSESVIKAHSMMSQINLLKLVDGRLPQAGNECVIDANLVTEEIGNTITISPDNSEETTDLFANKEYTIVGTVQTPAYMNFERGNTSLGNGKISGYAYFPQNAFDSEYFTEIFVTFDQNYEIYSTDYETYIDEKTTLVEDICEERVDLRYETILEDAKEDLMLAGMPEAQIEEALLEIEEPSFYVLTREDNIGYAFFENDATIVEGISTVFPVFFFLVAALVCITTMNRMVDEQRTQIGILKALGYSKIAIMNKYIFYSGSAALIGCISGFMIGSYLFPVTIWQAYNIMYGFTKDVLFVFDIPLAIISLAVALLCSIGATYFSCYYELNSVAAQLIRPKSPKSGKRIFLERFGFIWNRLKFLYKVSIRNVMRYKKRFFMMILGISGCCALLVTGYGIKDSIVGIVDKQYEEIDLYDMTINFREDPTDTMQETFENESGDVLLDYLYVNMESVTIKNDTLSKSVTLIVPKNSEEISNFINLHQNNGITIFFPVEGEAVLTNKTAEKLNVTIGDTIVVENTDLETMEVKVSAISENYISNYIYMSQKTYEEGFQKTMLTKTAIALIAQDEDASKISADLLNMENVVAASANSTMRERFGNMLESLNYIVLLVIFSAGALAFIVLYNLTNINITERIREIATIKVLGFYPIETAIYVFRENMVLTGIGGAVGLILGFFLHRFVMYNIDIDAVSFDVAIEPISYLYSIALTFLFAIIVNVVMYFKLGRINMAESMKTIE